MKQKFLIPLFLIFSSCWINSHAPAINKNYNFENVGNIYIDPIKDFSNTPRSGEIIQANLTHNLLKFDFDVTKIEQEILDTAGGDVIGMAGSIDEWIENGQIFLWIGIIGLKKIT